MSVYVESEMNASRETDYGFELDMWLAGVVVLKCEFGLSSFMFQKNFMSGFDLFVEKLNENKIR